MTFGQRLFEMRKSKGLSQENAAEKLGVTRQTVSKWETDQTTPDLDKIIPLCELFGVTSQELLTGKKTENLLNNSCCTQAETKEKLQNNKAEYKPYTEKLNSYRKRHAVLTGIAVGMYILSVTVFIVFENPKIMLISFFSLIAAATAIIVFSAMSKPKEIKPLEKTQLSKEAKLAKDIKNIISSVVLIIYLSVSFLTGAWYITWILWVVFALICEIINLVFRMKGVEIDEED